MDISGEQVAQGLVDEAVPGHGREPGEVPGGYPDVEMTPAIAGARMADMEVALVLDFENLWVQRGAQSALDGNEAVTGRA